MNPGTAMADKVAVAFITLSLVFTALFAYTVKKDYDDRNIARAAGGQAAAASDQSSTDTGSTDTGSTDTGSSSGGGGSTTTTSGGGSTGGGSAAGSLNNSQAASGVVGGKILVGGIFDMTGPVDSSVERDTVRAYFNKVNASGGVNGRQLVLLPCDGYYDNQHSHQCATTMVDNHVLAMVGNTFPGGEQDQVPFLNKEGIPTIGGLGVPNEYNNALSYPVTPSFAFSGNGLAAQMKMSQAGSQWYRHPAILYISDVPWVAPVLDAIVSALKAQGITPTHIEAASATNDPDYTQHVLNMEQKNDAGGSCASPAEHAGACPDSIIAATDPFSYAKLFQAMDRVGWHPPVVAGGLDKGNQQSAYGDQLGCGSCGGNGTEKRQAQSLVPFASPLDPANSGNPTVQDYYGSMQKYFPSQFGALDIYTQIAWSAAQVFVEAAKAAGPNLTRATLVDALNKMHNFQTGWGAPISYSPGNGHDPNHCYYFIKHDPTDADHGGTWRQYTPLQCY